MAPGELANRRLQPLGHLSYTRRQASLAGWSACVAEALRWVSTAPRPVKDGDARIGRLAVKYEPRAGRSSRPCFRGRIAVLVSLASALLTSHPCGHNQGVQDNPNCRRSGNEHLEERVTNDGFPGRTRRPYFGPPAQRAR